MPLYDFSLCDIIYVHVRLIVSVIDDVVYRFVFSISPSLFGVFSRLCFVSVAFPGPQIIKNHAQHSRA